MRTCLFTGLAVAVGLPSLVLAQQLPPVQPSQPSNKQSITVRGCISEHWIRQPQMSDADLTPTGTGYRLKGSKAMMNVLKEHDGHEDEISGTTQIANLRSAKVLKEKKKGRSRVYVGAGEERTPGGIEDTDTFTIEVSSITHLKPVCP